MHNEAHLPQNIIFCVKWVSSMNKNSKITLYEAADVAKTIFLFLMSLIKWDFISFSTLCIAQRCNYGFLQRFTVAKWLCSIFNLQLFSHGCIYFPLFCNYQKPKSWIMWRYLLWLWALALMRRKPNSLGIIWGLCHDNLIVGSKFYFPLVETVCTVVYLVFISCCIKSTLVNLHTTLIKLKSTAVFLAAVLQWGNLRLWNWLLSHECPTYGGTFNFCPIKLLFA